MIELKKLRSLNPHQTLYKVQGELIAFEKAHWTNADPNYTTKETTAFVITSHSLAPAEGASISAIFPGNSLGDILDFKPIYGSTIKVTEEKLLLHGGFKVIGEEAMPKLKKVVDKQIFLQAGGSINVIHNQDLHEDRWNGNITVIGSATSPSPPEVHPDVEVFIPVGDDLKTYSGAIYAVDTEIEFDHSWTIMGAPASPPAVEAARYKISMRIIDITMCPLKDSGMKQHELRIYYYETV